MQEARTRGRRRKRNGYVTEERERRYQGWTSIVASRHVPCVLRVESASIRLIPGPNLLIIAVFLSSGCAEKGAGSEGDRVGSGTEKGEKPPKTLTRAAEGGGIGHQEPCPGVVYVTTAQHATLVTTSDHSTRAKQTQTTPTVDVHHSLGPFPPQRRGWGTLLAFPKAGRVPRPLQTR